MFLLSETLNGNKLICFVFAYRDYRPKSVAALNYLILWPIHEGRLAGLWIFDQINVVLGLVISLLQKLLRSKKV
jgi:hypothetical protein